MFVQRVYIISEIRSNYNILQGSAAGQTYRYIYYLSADDLRKLKPYVTMTRFSLPASSAESQSACTGHDKRISRKPVSHRHHSRFLSVVRHLKRNRNGRFAYYTIIHICTIIHNPRTVCVPILQRECSCLGPVHIMYICILCKARGRCSFRCIMLKGQIDIFFFFFLLLLLFVCVGTYIRHKEVVFTQKPRVCIISNCIMCAYGQTYTREHVNHPTSAQFSRNQDRPSTHRIRTASTSPVHRYYTRKLNLYIYIYV